MIKAGDAVPSVAVRLVTSDGSSETTSDVVLGDGLVVFFTVPGAFTPTCHLNHLPGFVANADKLRAKGVSRIVCGSVNDAHVIKAWAEASDALLSVQFLADGGGDFARALGLDRQFPGMGLRFARSAMLIADGRVEGVFLEDAPGVGASGAPAVLMALEALHGRR